MSEKASKYSISDFKVKEGEDDWLFKIKAPREIDDPLNLEVAPEDIDHRYDFYKPGEEFHSAFNV